MNDSDFNKMEGRIEALRFLILAAVSAMPDVHRDQFEEGVRYGSERQSSRWIGEKDAKDGFDEEIAQVLNALA